MRQILALWLLWTVSIAALAAPHYELVPRQVAPDTWVIEGAVEDFAPSNGCNIINTGFIVTSEGVLVVNTGPSREYGLAQRAAIHKITALPVVKVLNLNLHPDYFLGNQAYDPSLIMATSNTRAGQAREGSIYVDNLFHLCGDFMKGTEAQPAQNELRPGPLVLGGHHLDFMEFRGHTQSDVVVIDRDTGVVFAGGLIFQQRIPTTPHAQLSEWLQSLQKLSVLLNADSLIVPSHGPVHHGLLGLDATRGYLLFLDQRLSQSAEQLKDLNEVLNMPVPLPWNQWGAMPEEYRRNIINLYPQYESGAFH